LLKLATLDSSYCYRPTWQNINNNIQSPTEKHNIP